MTEQELARGAARRLAIIRHAQEVTGNVARTCRCYGITRQAYNTWLRRYEEGGRRWGQRAVGGEPIHREHRSRVAWKSDALGQPEPPSPSAYYDELSRDC